MILWNNEDYTKKINSGVFPGTQGGPLMNQVAGKTQSYYEASSPEFKEYSNNVVEMSKYMCDIFKQNDIKLTTGGTDSHIILIHTGNKSGAEVADKLEADHNIVVNKNSIPNDPRGVWETSGIRIGTAAMVTKKGNDQEYFKTIANVISNVIKL
jgi:glycine hydroxymethyltransferase